MTPEIPFNADHACPRVVSLELFPFNHAKENPSDTTLRSTAETIIRVAIEHGFNPLLRGNVLATHIAPANLQLIEKTRAAVHASRTAVACGPYPVLPHEPQTPLIGACDIVINGDGHDIEALFRHAAEMLAVNERGVIYEKDIPVPQRYQGNRQYVALHEQFRPKIRVTLSLTTAPELPQLPLLALQQTTQRIGMPVSSASLSTVGMMGEYTTDSVYLAPYDHPLQRRRHDRTTNLDALSAPIYRDHTGRLVIRMPRIPDAVHFPDKAIAYYRKALAVGDNKASWTIIEAVYRSIRYSCLLTVPWLDGSINVSDGSIGQAVSVVQNAHASRRKTEAQKLSDELLTACIYDPRSAVDLVGRTGAHKLLAPLVSEGWNDPHKREDIASGIAASLETARQSNWPAGAIPSVIKGAIKHVVYGPNGISQPDPLLIEV